MFLSWKKEPVYDAAKKYNVVIIVDGHTFNC